METDARAEVVHGRFVLKEDTVLRPHSPPVAVIKEDQCPDRDIASLKQWNERSRPRSLAD